MAVSVDQPTTTDVSAFSRISQTWSELFLKIKYWEQLLWTKVTSLGPSLVVKQYGCFMMVQHMMPVYYWMVYLTFVWYAIMSCPVVALPRKGYIWRWAVVVSKAQPTRGSPQSDFYVSQKSLKLSHRNSRTLANDDVWFSKRECENSQSLQDATLLITNSFSMYDLRLNIV